MPGFINAKDGLERTPLHYAAWNDRVEVIQELLYEKSLGVNATDIDGYTALHLASRKGHDESVKKLLSKDNIDLNAKKTKSETRSRIEVDAIWETLELPKIEDQWFHESRSEMTPLHYAVEQGHIQVVRDLLSNPSIDVYVKNEDHKSAFDVQETNSKVEFMGELTKVLMLSGREGNQRPWEEFLWKELERIAREVSDETIDEIKQGKKGINIVHVIALAGLHQWVEGVLMSPKWDINAVDSDQQTPLHLAIARGHTEVVKSFLSQPTLRPNEEDKKGRSALQFAFERRKKDIEKLLLERPDVKDYVERLYRDRQVHVDAANAILVGAALIAGVTFAGWLQPPLGYTPYYEFAVPDLAAPPGTVESFAGVKQHLSIRVFWVCNSLSFSFAIATVIAGAGAILPMRDVFIKEQVQMVSRSLVITSVLLVLGVAFVLGAFAAAGFATLPPIMSLEANMIVTVCIGFGTCVALLVWFLMRLYRIRPSWLRYLPKERNENHLLLWRD